MIANADEFYEDNDNSPIGTPSTNTNKSFDNEETNVLDCCCTDNGDNINNLNFVISCQATENNTNLPSTQPPWPPQPSTTTTASTNESKGITPLLQNVLNNFKCSQCHRHKINNQCALKKCKDCCAQSPADCSVTPHRIAKLENFSKTTIQLIDSIIQNKNNNSLNNQNNIIWIKYNKGLQSGSGIIAIEPLMWLNRPISFIAVCAKTNVRKTYYLNHILEAKQEPF